MDDLEELFPDARNDIARIATLDGDDRRDAINAFMSSQATLMRDLAFRSVRHHSNGGRDSELVNDVMQVYAMAAMKLIDDEIANPGSVSGMAHRWEAVLTTRGRSAAVEFLDRANPSVPTTTHRRRRYLLQRHIELAKELGRPPTDTELAQYATKVAAEHRADASRQSMVFTARDVRDLNAGSGTVQTPGPEIAVHETYDEPDFASDAILSSAESPVFVRAVLEQAAKWSPECAAVARAWFGAYLDGGEDRRILESDEIAEALGLTRRQVQHQQTRIRTIAIDIAQARFGITGTTY